MIQMFILPFGYGIPLLKIIQEITDIVKCLDSWMN